MGNVDKRPLISVIVPVYKVEPYLRACVDSILAQTYTNLEILLIDDGSPDDCPAICDEYAQKDRRIKVLHKENGGPSDARNAGIALSCGTYLTFIDSDDTVADRWIEDLYAAINDCDVAVAGVTYLQAQGSYESRAIDPDFLKLVQSSLFGYACNKLYKKEAIGDLRFLSIPREDMQFNLSLISSGRSFTSADTCGYYYYQREGSILHASSVPDVSTVFSCEKAIRQAIDHETVPQHRAVYNHVLYSYVTDYIYKMLLSDKLSKKEKNQRIKQIVGYPPFKENLKKEFADNTLYRILYLGIAWKAGFIVRCGFEFCQKRSIHSR
jgi:glycosyltransferase involved in cell wall biosynthesis